MRQMEHVISNSKLARCVPRPSWSEFLNSRLLSALADTFYVYRCEALDSIQNSKFKIKNYVPISRCEALDSIQNSKFKIQNYVTVSRCEAQSMNNNPENILFLCPNHHRVIHKAKAKYDTKNKLYLFSNGMKEKLA